MSRIPSTSFGPGNRGQQVGQNYGTINAEFHLLPERLETPPIPFATIPFSRDPDFVDRGDILDQIDKQCSKPAGRVALVGLGGVGKSQLAIEYAHRIAEQQPDKWVFWVYAGTQARVEEGFRTIADAVKLPGRNQPKADIPQLMYSWLSNERNGRWIMILDSADNRDVLYNANSSPSPTSSDAHDRRSFATYLPQSRNGSIIVTTRNRDLAFKLTGRRQNMIDVGPMAQTDALTLLEKKLGSPASLDVAADLVKALDLVPLAISQAAAYIQARAPRTSLEKYLAEFRENERKRARLLGYDGGDLRRDGGASNAILTTWQISFDHIRSKRRTAADLLSLMSFFDRQGIPGWVLKPPRATTDTARVQNIDLAGVGESDASGDATDDGIDDDADVDDALDDGFEDDVAMLRDYCLIAVDVNGDEFEMHGLVQLSTKRWLEASGQLGAFIQQYIERIATSFPIGDYENWATCRELFAHAQMAVNYQPSEDIMETWATLLYNGGWYARSQGIYEIAQQMLAKARKVREKRLGEEDVATLASITMFALVLLNRGRWDEAEKLFVQVMETSKTKLGADHPSTLTSMANLASTFWNQGRWEEAEKLFVQVMETRKTKLGADHPSTLASMANLASTFWNQGRWEEAEKLEVQVMETSKTKLGADHPDTLTSMANLASTYRNQGRWEEAEKLEVQVMETSKTKLGADHPDMLTSMANLASTYRNQGRWEEAEKLEVQVMEMSKTKLGADHPDTLTSMANLASTFWNQGRWEEAEKLEVQVMETSKTKLGADHPSTLMNMNNLAFIWKSQGRYVDALALMDDCAQARRRVLGEQHPYTLSSLTTVSEWSS
ncbi:P-loop containing nucleoside triphosphate hydrolase protein [Podospora didyma]|uniref:P-loop containing nucleoside triphosphate hydrolase protein n=1 Tax=Podospora didyma TaxID=330526 RepID=A0AAE0K1F9_9PEZI|nr:P-loop containing nucleoside triphosphate hydrolase protein [Podospora didyma]